MYKYYFRPEYGSTKLLIEFFHGAENEKFLPDFLNTITELNPKIVDTTDLWMNDEVRISIDSDIGEFIVSKDVWGFAFLMAENNQLCLSRINSIIEVAENFEKIDIDFENFKL